MTVSETPTETAPIFYHPYRVLFQDIDAAGIVFFARFFEIFHDAYVEALRAGGCDLVTVLKEKQWAAPLVSAHADYRRPLRFGDEVVVEVAAVVPAVASEGDPSKANSQRNIVVTYRVVAKNDSTQVYATGRTEHATVDLATFKRIAVPAVLQKALLKSV